MIGKGEEELAPDVHSHGEKDPAMGTPVKVDSKVGVEAALLEPLIGGASVVTYLDVQGQEPGTG